MADDSAPVIVDARDEALKEREAAAEAVSQEIEDAPDSAAEAAEVAREVAEEMALVASEESKDKTLVYPWRNC